MKDEKIFHSGWEHMLGERSIVAMLPLTTVVRHPDKTNDPSGRGGNRTCHSLRVRTYLPAQAGCHTRLAISFAVPRINCADSREEIANPTLIYVRVGRAGET